MNSNTFSSTENSSGGVSLSENVLKLIAVFAMIMDHIAWVFIPGGSAAAVAMHFIGRITMPVMSYFLAKGFLRTADFKRYALRLFIFALISQAPFSLCFYNSSFTLSRLNVMFTLLFSLILLRLYYDEGFLKGLKILFASALILALVYCDWQLYCPAMCFYFTWALKEEEKPKLKGTARFLFIISSILYLNGALAYLPALPPINALIKNMYMFGVALSSPLICSVKRAESVPKMMRGFMRYFFYWVYPVHLIGIWALRLLL